ncbi:MAG: hypothetical protein ACFB10_03920 [Salibacteraceae bacterium]
MPLNFHKFFGACLLFCLLISCQEHANVPVHGAAAATGFEEEEEADAAYGSNLTEEQSDLRLFTLPTPVQTAAVLKAGDYAFDESLMLPMGLEGNTNLIKAIQLGAYMVDLGYTTMFNQRQNSLLYLKETSKLKNELGIAGNQDQQIVRKFQEVENNPDSLSRLILDSYAEAHSYFQAQEREGVGLLILVGCYIEGVHISINTSAGVQTSSYQALIAQQKMYLKSLLELLRYFEYQGEVLPILKEMEELNQQFEEVKVRYRTQGIDQQINGQVSEETLSKIHKKVTVLRGMINK